MYTKTYLRERSGSNKISPVISKGTYLNYDDKENWNSFLCVILGSVPFHEWRVLLFQNSGKNRLYYNSSEIVGTVATSIADHWEQSKFE